MKTIIIALALLFLTITVCNSTKLALKISNTLDGTWELKCITGPIITFDRLYPNKKQNITDDLKKNRVSGSNSCNQYFGVVNSAGNKIDFKEAKIKNPYFL